MASLASWESSQVEAAEGGYHQISPEKSKDGGRWYFSRKEVEENSSSRHDGIDLKKETYLRKSYCTFLQDLGMRLKVLSSKPYAAIPVSSGAFCPSDFVRTYVVDGVMHRSLEILK